MNTNHDSLRRATSSQIKLGDFVISFLVISRNFHCLCRMHWLKTTGSPSSKIEKCEFRNQQDIEDYTFNNFEIQRD